ncbi:MAG: sodium:alanine symporter family protein, partial [Fibrobacter sp.]|nr:sodium:alanine symporter family protein [Fibrobacter sp.]
MEAFNAFLDTIDGYVWGIPLIGIVLFVGILLTSRLGVLQVTNLGNALRYMLHSEKEGEGEVS